MNRKDMKIQEVQFPFCRGFLHTVERGDTLYKLSRKYRVRLSDIMLANPYVNVYNLQVGDELCIPSGNAIVINQDDLERIRESIPGSGDEENGVTPVNTAPTAPTTPTMPMTPTTPTMPTMPTEPTMPAMPTEPTMPTMPTMPIMPTEPTEPISPIPLPTPIPTPTPSPLEPPIRAVPIRTTPIITTPGSSGIESNMGEAEEIIFSGNETISEILERLGITLQQFEEYMRNISES